MPPDGPMDAVSRLQDLATRQKRDAKAQRQHVVDQINTHMPEFMEIIRGVREAFGPPDYIRIETPDGVSEWRK